MTRFLLKIVNDTKAIVHSHKESNIMDMVDYAGNLIIPWAQVGQLPEVQAGPGQTASSRSVLATRLT